MKKILCSCLLLWSVCTAQAQAMRASTQEGAEKTLTPEAAKTVQDKAAGGLIDGSVVQPKRGSSSMMFAGKRQLYTKQDKQACEARGGRIRVLYNNQTRPTRTMMNTLPKRVTGWTCYVRRAKE